MRTNTGMQNQNFLYIYKWQFRPHLLKNGSTRDQTGQKLEKKSLIRNNTHKISSSVFYA
ncbi:hypothetical protein HanRHA438_Chr15g0721801 [Helianthus annuus]|nr:hypothetical protein HanIR_Chr15g0771841 [Helianthus annuus]KAJ0846169.1 hypothetical protein HanRHA438_Chr15g0721801 [Helianthus annuus]